MTKIFFLLVLLALGCHALKESDIDRHSYANFLEFDPIKLDLDLQLRFDLGFIYGVARHHYKALVKNVKQLYLDMGTQITISQIFIEKKGEPKKEIEQKDFQLNLKPLSYQLQIKVGSIWDEIKEGDDFFVDIYYYMQYSSSRQIVYQNITTGDKVDSYFYIICKPFCREILPLMDSLSIRVPVNIEVEHPIDWKFYGSGVLVNSKSSTMPGYQIDEFDEGKMIPASAITVYGATNAIRIHDTEQSYFVCNLEQCEDIVIEFQNRVQSYIDAIELYLEQPLPFDYIQLIFPPKSFPFFDLEAGYTSYITETILTGDGNETFNIARTIARQYFGSCIAPQNWSNIWIVEGMVAFVERKIIEMVRGEIFADTESMLGNHSMYAQMMEIGFGSTFTTLLPKFEDYQDPWDYMTEIPREKGFQFLKEIEAAMAPAKLKNPGPNMETPMQLFLQDFIDEYIYAPDTKYLDYIAFRDFWWSWIANHLEDPSPVVMKINFNTWIKNPGMPPSTLDFDNGQYEEIRDLSEVFLQLGGVARPSNWNILLDQQPEYVVTFLEYLIVNYKRVNSKIYKQLERYYSFSDETDLELASLWFTMAIISKQSKDKAILQKIEQYLFNVGRIELIAPIYEAFNLTSQRDIGCTFMKENKYWLHPLTLEYFEPLKCPLT